MMKAMVCLSFACGMAFARAEGNVHWVATNGSDDAAGTEEAPLASLTAAIERAADGDVVKVKAGTYTIPPSRGSRMSGTMTIDYGIPAYWLTNAVTVVGVEGAESTVFDGANGANRYAFLLDNAKARVEGITVSRIKTTVRYEVQESPAFEVKNGTLVDCVSRDHALKYVGGINLRKGVLVGCRVANVSCSDGLSLSAGINRTQGSATCYVTNCIVEGCKGKQGPGFLLQQPTVVYGCLVRNCLCEVGTRGHMAPLAVNHASVTVENCVITNNNGRTGGGVYLNKAGIVRNCLIADNSCADSTGGGGVRITAGTLENCTVVGNVVDASLGATGDGIHQTGGTVRNCIVSMNGKGRVLANDSNHVKTGGSCTYTCTYPSSVAGEGNVWEDPMFADLTERDYRLSGLSSLFDIGQNQAWMVSATDLDGAPRIEHETVNPGCYETLTPTVRPLTCSFVADILAGGSPLVVNFSSSVKNPGETVSYAWSFGDGGVSDEANPSHTYTAAGRYDVQLVVTSGEQTFTSVSAGFITVGTPIAYVSQSGAGIWPYDTPEKATNDVNEAVSALYKAGDDYGRLVFMDGTYYPKEVVRLVRPKIRLECANGPGRVFLNGSRLTTPHYGLVSIQEPTAVVDGLVFTNCSSSASAGTGHGSALTIGAGVATNCTIAKCNSGTYTVSALHMTGGTFTHGLVWGGYNNDSGAGGGGRPGFYMNGSSARLVSSVISNNTAVSAVGAGQLVSGLISNCVIVANKQTGNSDTAKGILQVEGGMVVNTKIVGNSYASSKLGTVCLAGGTMRNCLVADNAATRAVGGVAVSGAATLESCTIAGNATESTASISGLNVNEVRATVCNVLVAGNGDGEGSEWNLGATATVTTCFLGTDPVSGEGPLFRNPAKGDYRIRSASPARDAGTMQPWMTDSCDLQGVPRILNNRVDIGCYEVPQSGIVLIFR